MRWKPSGQRGQIGEEAQMSRVECRLQVLKEQSPIEPREHMDGQEEVRAAGDPALAAGRQTAAGDDAMNMRVMGERLPPCVEDGDKPDVGAQAPKCLGSAAMVRNVSAAAWNSMA